MGKRPVNSKTNEYIYRVNRVIDYIDANIGREVSLKELAAVAGFSEYHFHRIFKGVTKETLSKFMQRIRVEKAAAQLIHNPTKTITEIAFANGFNSVQFFARVFKEHFKQSAGEWRKNKGKNSKIVQANVVGSDYNRIIPKDAVFPPDLSVTVRNIPDLDVAYLRHIGPYKGDMDLFSKLFTKLFEWADSHGLLGADTKVLALYNDFTEITAEDRLRLTACLTIDPQIEPQEPMGKLKIKGGKYAIARFEIGKDEFEKAWNLMYGEWLPQSGYQPEDQPAFELFHNDPQEHPQGKHIVDLCIPVKPL